jgi:hypothetical protein
MNSKQHEGLLLTFPVSALTPDTLEGFPGFSCFWFSLSSRTRDGSGEAAPAPIRESKTLVRASDVLARLLAVEERRTLARRAVVQQGVAFAGAKLGKALGFPSGVVLVPLSPRPAVRGERVFLGFAFVFCALKKRPFLVA